MKQKINKFIGMAGLVFLFQHSFSQATTSGLGPLGHTGAAPAIDWCGWNAGSPISFNLEHRGNLVTQPINFLTNSIQRMTITNGVGPTAGFVGIGSFAAPQNLLHINNSGAGGTFQQFTNPTTGPGAANGFLVGIGPAGAAILNQQDPVRQIDFITGGSIRARISNNLSLSNFGPIFSVPNWVGDGIRVSQCVGCAPTANIDIFTSTFNQCYIINLCLAA